MKLYEAMEKLLKQKGEPLSTQQIANELNSNGWYKKKDGSLIQSNQASARVSKKPNIFLREKSKIRLKKQYDNNLAVCQSPSKTTELIENQEPVKTNSSNKIKEEKFEKLLMDRDMFRSVSIIDDEVPETCGIYCIRIVNSIRLPELIRQHLIERQHNILYIGIAPNGLKRRLLDNELRAKGHGTFFRSIGCVLGYKPQYGSMHI